MQYYKDVGGDSSVSAYEIGSDSITVQFKDGATYIYTYTSAGRDKIETMKGLATSGDGLDAYLSAFAAAKVQVVGIGRILSESLLAKPSLIHQLNPTQFEEFVCDRLVSMGFEPQRVGATNRKDGGIDVLFWPRSKNAFPFLGAAQVKHHRDPNAKEGPSTVRDFAGTIAGHPINAGLIVTNTSFTPDAEWFCRERAKLVRLRGFTDISRWLLNNFSDEAEWREIPSSIEFCPGVVVKIR